LRLINRSNLTGRCIGKSLGLAPCPTGFTPSIGYCVKRFTDPWYVRHHCCI
jgi:hypothetical protein